MNALWALLGLFLVLLVIRALILDARRCKATRARWRRQVTTMSVASRARNMQELPPAFMAELRQAMHLDPSEEEL